MNDLPIVSDSVRKPKRMMDKTIIKAAIKDAFLKLDPRRMVKNPIIFMVEVGFLIAVLLSIFPQYFGSAAAPWFNPAVSVILLFTVLFANFAEALAEGRGKAQADSLKQTKKRIWANKVMDGRSEKGHQTICEKGILSLYPKVK